MKTRIIIISALVIITASSFTPATVGTLSLTNTTLSVQNTEFGFFRAHRQGKSGVATWGLTNNQGVSGFTLQRTYQDPTDPYSMWEEVTYMACTESRSFTFKDDAITPGRIYYRVIAHIIDGSSVVSEIADIRIVSH
jgi:hypothetical protein